MIYSTVRDAILTRIPHMLRHCAALCLAALTLPASANCSIQHITANDQIRQVFRANGGFTFKNYDAVCDKLQKANAKLVISGGAGVLVSRSYGWTHISVADKNNSYLVVVSFSTQSVWLNDYASDDKARSLLWSAINDALEEWHGLDKALDELNQVRQAARKTAAR